MQKQIRLRGNAPRRSGPYPLGEIPHTVVVEIAKTIVHRLAVGQGNITGDDFAGMFADAISGEHRASPLGIADIEWNGCAWSAKTVQHGTPFAAQCVRLIAGRNSPAYAAGITDPYADIQQTGQVVLDVWNARVNESLKNHDDLRIIALIRNMSTLEFSLFEKEAQRFVPSEFHWERNARGNLQGYDGDGRHRFTWQPHGGQFTIMQQVPQSAFRFSIRQRPIIVEKHHVMELVQWAEDWVVVYQPPE